MNIAGYNIAGGNSLADANSVRITGGWVNPVAGALGTPTYCVLIQNTDGVEVDGVQFYKGNASFSYGVNALSSSGLTLTDLQVSGVTNGISLTDCAFSSITSCRFNNPSGLNANNQLYVLRGSEIVANSNVFLGYGNHAIEIDHCSLFTGFGNSCSGTPNFNTTLSQISPTGTNFTTGNNPGF